MMYKTKTKAKKKPQILTHKTTTPKMIRNEPKISQQKNLIALILNNVV
jgi:hypothetical protein